MVLLKVLTGKHADTTRTFSGTRGDCIEAFRFFMTIATACEEWELDFGFATIAERYEWKMADVLVRCLRAFAQGRSVLFENFTFGADRCDLRSMLDAVEQVEQVITRSMKSIIVVSEGEGGLVLTEVETVIN